MLNLLISDITLIITYKSFLKVAQISDLLFSEISQPFRPSPKEGPNFKKKKKNGRPKLSTKFHFLMMKYLLKFNSFN